MRKHWIDNLRWVTVLLVLFYHVIYYYNGKGVVGGIGGFGGPQYQDFVMYLLYPWFMPLLFLLAGISARYALDAHSEKEWFQSRTRKLLVPATIGLFVFQWIAGYFNTHTLSYTNGIDMLADTPGIIKYVAWSLSGTGPLWFIQNLWLFSLVLLLVRKVDAQDRFYSLCGKMGLAGIILLGVVYWLGTRTLIMNPRPESLDGLYNGYKPFFYLLFFLSGYFVFSHENVLTSLRKGWIPLMVCAVASGITLLITTFGEDNTTPVYLSSPLNCVYGWLMCLAMIGWFAACFDDRKSKFADYMCRNSFAIYVVHYIIISGFGYSMKVYTTLPPVAMYVLLTVAVFTLSPLLVELIRRIPVIRWCVLGEKTKQIKN